MRILINAMPSPLEVCEHLDELRALSLGMTIAVDIPAMRPGIGVDTPDDLQRAEQELLLMHG